MINGGEPILFTVSDNSNIVKGTLMQVIDPWTALSGGSSTPFAGITVSDKSGGDGKTKIALYTKGIFDLKQVTGGTTTVGKIVSMSGTNMIYTSAATDIENGYAVGKALETSSSDEVIAVAVGSYI